MLLIYPRKLSFLLLLFWKREESLRLGVIPTQNMPSKSLPSASSLPERRHLNIVKKDDVSDIAENKSCYKIFDELCTRVAKLKLNEWDVTHKKENRFSLKKFVPPFIVPQFEVAINSSLKFTVAVYGWILPENHNIYSDYGRSLGSMVSNILKKIGNHRICVCVNVSEGVNTHVVPLLTDIDVDLTAHSLSGQVVQPRQYFRPVICWRWRLV